MASERTPGDFELINSGSTTPDIQIEKPKVQPAEINDPDLPSFNEKRKGEPSTTPVGRPSPRQSHRHRSNDDSMHAGNVQTFARALLLAQLPLIMAAGVTRALFRDRHRLVQSENFAEDALGLATEQAGVVLENCQNDLNWVDHEVPEWVNSKIEQARQRKQERLERCAHHNCKKGNKSTRSHHNSPSEGEYTRLMSRSHSRMFGRRHPSMLKRLFVPLLLVLSAHWLLAIPLALLRLTFKLKAPVWILFGVGWVLASRRNRRRRNSCRCRDCESDSESESDVD